MSSRLKMSLAVVAWALVLAAGGLLAVSPAPAEATTYEQFQLTTNSYAELVPVVDAGRLAWIGKDAQGWGVFVYDSLTGQTEKVSTQATDWDLLELKGDLVVWGSNWGGSYAVRLVQIPSGQERMLAAPTNSDGYITTDGRYVAWVDRPAGSLSTDVYLYDFRSGTGSYITNDALDEYGVILDDGYLAWQRRSAVNPDNWVDVVSYDTRTAQTTVLTTQAQRYRSIAMEGGRVVWPQGPWDATNLFVHDLRTGIGGPVIQTPTIKEFADIHGNKLVWSDGWNDASEVQVHDLLTQLTTPLSDNAYPDLFAQSDGRLVGWMYRPTWGDEVRLYNTATGELLNLGAGFLQSGAGVSRGRVAWAAGAFPTMEIFTAVFPLFDDVPLTHHYFDAIQGMGERGLISGYPKANGAADFHPAEDVLRAQFAKMIAGALMMAVLENAVLPPFTDLGPDDATNLYPHEYVAAAYSAGITTGTTPTTFSPYVSISRAQAVTMVYRGLRALFPGLLTIPPAGYVGSLGDFNSTHQAGMQALEHNGLLANLTGFGPGWDPWVDASRAELAEILWQVMKRIADK